MGLRVLHLSGSDIMQFDKMDKKTLNSIDHDAYGSKLHRAVKKHTLGTGLKSPNRRTA